jgi:tetratricopeptide (TPR) repeat protein
MLRWLVHTVFVCALTTCACADTFVVLPFFNVSQNANLDWIGEGLSESIGEALASAGIVVLDREERVEVYRRLSIRPHALLTRASVIKIADTLGAGQVVFGQFDLQPAAEGLPLSKESLKISARLVDLTRAMQGPEFGEAGSLEDLAVLQRHLAWQTLQLVIPGTAPSETDFGSRHPAIRLDAIENYVRGLLAPSAEEKHRLFTQAARLDQAFSQPCFQLGKLYFRKKEFKVAAEWLGKVSSSDVHFREANFLSGLCLYNAGDFPGAQNAFQAVASVVPLNEVYNDIGAAQSRRNLPEAIDSFKKALEGDPSDPAYQFNVGYAFWKRTDFDAAAERFQAVLERDPQDAEASAMLERCLKRSGPRPGDTKTERLERLKTNYEESAWWQLKAALQPKKP